MAIFNSYVSFVVQLLLIASVYALFDMFVDPFFDSKRVVSGPCGHGGRWT
jgi:hypothetical protein